MVDLRSSDVAAGGALGRDLSHFIANSTLVLETQELALTRAVPILATEVSRDFIPPCPARMSPAQAAALGPAISGDAEP